MSSQLRKNWKNVMPEGGQIKMCYNWCNGWCMVSPCGGQCPFDEDEQPDCEEYEEDTL